MMPIAQISEEKLPDDRDERISGQDHALLHERIAHRLHIRDHHGIHHGQGRKDKKITDIVQMTLSFGHTITPGL